MNKKIEKLSQEISQFENLILRGQNDVKNIETQIRKAELEIAFRQGKLEVLEAKANGTEDKGVL